MLLFLEISFLLFGLSFLLYFYRNEIKRYYNSIPKSKFDFNVIFNNKKVSYYNIDLALDSLQYLCNRYNIPLERVFLHNNGNYGTFNYFDNTESLYTHNKIYDSTQRCFYYAGIKVNKENPYINAPYPTTFDKYAICIHEIFHWVRKHQYNDNTLCCEYEAERLTKKYLNNSVLFKSQKFDIFYYDVLIHSNLSVYLDKYKYKQAEEYMKTLLNSEQVISKCLV